MLYGVGVIPKNKPTFNDISSIVPTTSNFVVPAVAIPAALTSTASFPRSEPTIAFETRSIPTTEAPIGAVLTSFGPVVIAKEVTPSITPIDKGTVAVSAAITIPDWTPSTNRSLAASIAFGLPVLTPTDPPPPAVTTTAAAIVP